ncbi:MAG: radical SAM protein [Methanomicrobiales archaeon]|nr:radical SAM protein [Methanomicrobiales archaeon]
MEWAELKARALLSGPVQVSGVPADEFIARSSAGPGAGMGGSVFFSVGGSRRVRLPVGFGGQAVLTHTGEGRARLSLDGVELGGQLEPIGYHCPRQAYLTVSSGCIFGCRYCPVPTLPRLRKTVDAIETMVQGVRDRIDAISLTSGVMENPREEEEYVLGVISALSRFRLPIGVSTYPNTGTAERLADAGVCEVKFNLEAATPDLFSRMCGGLDRDLIWQVLKDSVSCFGEGRVFSNVIVGLGEGDADISACIDDLVEIGVIPVLRPLTPAAELSSWQRPSLSRLSALAVVHRDALRDAGLDPRRALTMCTACTGCDLTPGRDL